MIRILIDENIPLAKEIFDSIGEVVTISGREISNSILKDFDVLIVRSITKVDESLLRDTPIQFVGTATAGIDHIDIDYLKSHKIYFTNAHGSNATSVVEYVLYLIYKYAVENRIELKNKKLGIIGVGAVGGQLADKTEKLGFQVYRNDPPLQDKGIQGEWFHLDTLYKCDILSLHTPLNKEGQYKTHHLFNMQNLTKLNCHTFLINASRGSVIDNTDLLTLLRKTQLKTVSLDVWENEPYISIPLLTSVYTATPHIAGYSYDGKVRGTEMIFQQLCQFYNFHPNINIQDYKIKIDSPLLHIDNSSLSHEECIHKTIQSVYNFEDDFTRCLKLSTYPTKKEQGTHFDMLRKTYPVRREFSNYTIELAKSDFQLEQYLKILNFHIKEHK